MKIFSVAFFFAIIALGDAAAQTEVDLFIGTYTGTGSHGIYIARFNTTTGMLFIKDSLATENPSYLAINQQQNRLYAVNENGGSKPGAVSSFFFDSTRNSWALLNAYPISTGGNHPCYISIDAQQQFLAVANYSGGSLAILSLKANGAIHQLRQLLLQQGSSISKERQQSPHVHAAVFSPNGKQVFIADLGSDRIKIFPFNSSKAMPIDTLGVKVTPSAPGAGPRHLVFHPLLKRCYVMEELSGHVSVYAMNKSGLRQLQSIKADPISPQPGSADIHISANGKYLYASHRAAANLLSVFGIHPQSGKLKAIGTQSTMGVGPRNFALDPSGQFLLVANQRSNSIVVFKINESTGMPEPTGASFALPSPVCLIFGSR